MFEKKAVLNVGEELIITIAAISLIIICIAILPLLLKINQLNKIERYPEQHWQSTNSLWKKRMFFVILPLMLICALFAMARLMYIMTGSTVSFSLAIIIISGLLISPLFIMPLVYYFGRYFREKNSYYKKFLLPKYLSSPYKYWHNYPRFDKIQKKCNAEFNKNDIQFVLKSNQVGKYVHSIEYYFPEEKLRMVIEKIRIHYNQEFRFIISGKDKKTPIFPNKISRLIESIF